MFERFIDVQVQIHDSAFLKTIPVKNIKQYLENKGWSIQEEIKRNEETKGWIFEKEEMFVTLPVSETFGDYALRISELLQRVNVIELGNQLSIVEEIFAQETD